MAAPQNESMKTFIMMVANILCVILIVVLVKLLFGPPYYFTYGNALMAIHFICTALLLYVCCKFKIYEIKRVPMSDVVKLSVAQVASVAFVNYSLMYNSVGMYQLLKLVNIPVVCVMEFFWQGTTYSADLKTSLFVLLLGVGLSTVTEPPKQLSFVGITHGMLATVATGVYQIYCGTMSKKNGVNAMQMLHWQAPVTAFMFAILSLLTDNTREMFSRVYSKDTIYLVLLTGVIAFGVNLTVFLIVGRTSPVTYQVVGHVKTTAVLLSGFLVFGQPVDAKNLFGVVLAMAGIVWYTHIKTRPAPTKKMDVVEADVVEAAKAEATDKDEDV